MTPTEQSIDLVTIVKNMSTKDQEEFITRIYRECKIIGSSAAYAALMKSANIKQDVKNDISKLAEELESALSFADLNEIPACYGSYSGLIKQYGIIMPQIHNILDEHRNIANGNGHKKYRVSFV